MNRNVVHVNLEDLNIPPNAFVLGYAAHDPLLREASLIVTHGGHGTAMRALRHGVPAILMPAVAHDQPFVSATLQEWGCGQSCHRMPMFRPFTTQQQKFWEHLLIGKMLADEASMGRSAVLTNLRDFCKSRKIVTSERFAELDFS